MCQHNGLLSFHGDGGGRGQVLDFHHYAAIGLNTTLFVVAQKGVLKGGRAAPAEVGTLRSTD